jgi:phytoene dehydrogenase-like protein
MDALGKTAMKTFLLVKLSLLPLLLFWTLVGQGMPAAGLFGGLVLGLLIGAQARWRGRLTSLDVAVPGLLGLLALGWLVAPEWVAARATALSFLGLGALALASVALRRPWTAEFSRHDYAGQAGSPIFQGINMALSALWGAIFLVFAAARAWHWPAGVTLALGLFGAATSTLGPKLLLRLVLGRVIRSMEGHAWPMPAIGGTATAARDCDVAIIGAGIGGLTAAALLADAGLRVIVAEQHVVPGGFCHSWLRKEWHGDRPLLFRFDSGVHDISGVHAGGPVSSVLERLGVAERIDWQRLDHRYHLAGRVIDVPRGGAAYVAELGRHFPASAAGIAAVFATIERVLAAMYSLAPEQGGIPGAPRTPQAMLDFAARHPEALRWMRRPFADLLAAHVEEAAAREVLGALVGYVSDDPAAVTVAEMAPILAYHLHGGFYPLGGSGRLAEVLVEAIEARGGQVLLKAPVQRILVEDRRAAGITLARGGRRITAGAVISNADLGRTLRELLEPGLLPAGAGAIRPACSAFGVNLGIDFVPDLPPCLHVEGEPSVSIVMPSLVDPTAAPAGCATVELLTLLPQAEAASWFGAAPAGDEEHRALRRSSDYVARKAALGDRMIATAERAIPGLSRHILHRSEASPVTFARYDRSADGAIYGVARADRQRGVKSPLPGLLIAGAAEAGPGVEAALISGARAAEAILPGLLAAWTPGAMPAVREAAMAA